MHPNIPLYLMIDADRRISWSINKIVDSTGTSSECHTILSIPFNCVICYQSLAKIISLFKFTIKIRMNMI